MFRPSPWTLKGKHFVGDFLLAKARAKSTRQLHNTGPAFNKRKFFPYFTDQKNDKNGHHRHLLRRTVSARQRERSAGPGTGRIRHDGHEYKKFEHLAGDTRQRPRFDYSFGVADPDTGHVQKERADGVMYAWRKRGRYQLYQISGKGTPTFQCFHCGYPCKSKLVAVLDDNWDWRMCQRCYTQVVHRGQQYDE